MSYFLVLSHFFLLHLFVELNFTVSFNFQVTQSLLAYFLLSHSFSYCMSLFLFVDTVPFLISYWLFLAVSFNLLLHLFIELILLPHLIVQVTHCLACFLLLIVFYYVSRLTVSRCVTLVSHFCHWVWPYIKEKVCEQMTKF